MKCARCNNETTHIVYKNGIESCPNCSSISENTLTDNKVTRARVRMDSVKFEGDTISPRIYDKIKRKVVPNEEFIKRTPQGLKNFFTPEELTEHGYTQSAKKVIKDKENDKKFKDKLESEVEHHGSADKAVREFICQHQNKKIQKESR